jgi:hypothetical protein
MSYFKPLPSLAELRYRLALRSDGVLIWKRPTSLRAKAGAEAGCLTRGYIKIGIHGLPYMAHRIVWALKYGRDPAPHGIDHVDGNKSNNHPSNLRLCNQSQNGLNQGVSMTNTSGVKGVSYDPTSKARPWRSYVAGQKLGRFSTKEEATRALVDATTRMKDHAFYRHDFVL